MSVNKSDEYRHNNPDRAFVDADFTRGGRRSVPNRAALYALASKADQLKQDVTIVRILSDGENGGAVTEVLLVDATNIGSTGGWELYSAGTGGGTPGTGGGYSTSPYDFLVAQDGENTFQLPAGTTGLDYPVQVQTPNPQPNGAPAVDGETNSIPTQHTAFDASTGILTVFAAANLKAGQVVLGVRRYGGGGGVGGPVQASDIVGVLDKSQLPALDAQDIADLSGDLDAYKAAQGPLVLTAAPLLATPQNGALEFDGANLYFTKGGVRAPLT